MQTQISTREMNIGWIQRLALGCAQVHKPDILLLGKPTSGVYSTMRQYFWDLIYTLAGQGLGCKQLVQQQAKLAGMR